MQQSLFFFGEFTSSSYIGRQFELLSCWPLCSFSLGQLNEVSQVVTAPIYRLSILLLYYIDRNYRDQIAHSALQVLASPSPSAQGFFFSNPFFSPSLRNRGEQLKW